MSELAREILEEEEEQDEQDVAILDDASAEILIRRIREANEEYERMEAWYKSQLKRMKEKRDNTVAWAEGCLRKYFDLVPKKESKTQQSYQLPGAKLVLKTRAPEYDVDDAVLIPWLKADGWQEFIRVKETADWAKLKPLLKVSGTGMVDDDGQVVPGITVTEREPEFQVVIK